MKLTSAIAVYFIVWWLCLFMVLPFGIRNAHEAGVAVDEGHEPGAPVSPMLWRNVAATTVLASIIFLLVYGEVTYGWVSLYDLSWISHYGAP